MNQRNPYKNSKGWKVALLLPALVSSTKPMMDVGAVPITTCRKPTRWCNCNPQRLRQNDIAHGLEKAERSPDSEKLPIAGFRQRLNTAAPDITQEGTAEQHQRQCGCGPGTDINTEQRQTKDRCQKFASAVGALKQLGVATYQPYQGFPT